MRLVFVEPQCTGYTHVPFNSALLATAIEAFPKDHLSFVAEKQHVGLVRQALRIHGGVAIENITWVDLADDSDHTASGGAWRSYKRLFARSFVIAQKLSADSVVLTSLDGLGLIFLSTSYSGTRFG